MASKVSRLHLHEAQAKTLGREGLLSICSGPLPPFKDFLRTAIRAGDKTQTRRIPKYQPLDWCTRFEPAPFEGYGKVGYWIQMKDDATGQRGYLRCPYGLAGQVRYLREPLMKRNFDGSVWYRTNPEPVEDVIKRPAKWRWKRDTLPQIFMPKEYARTFVYMKDIRIEKLQDISEGDAVAEGCRKWIVGMDELDTARSDFQQLWNGINPKQLWHDKDLYVWVLEFSVIYGGI